MSLIKKLKKKWNKHSKANYDKYRDNNVVEIPDSIKSLVNLRIDGVNNTVIIKSDANCIRGRLHISIYGDNNTVYIDNSVSLSNSMSVLLGQNHINFSPVHDCTFSIANGTSIESMTYSTFNSGAKCIIGNDCMIANDVTILNTDAHPIFDINSRTIVNFVDGITIGNHVWLGAKSSVLKNTIIADDCIIGYGAVVSGKFTTQNCAIAGNPAKIIKQGITWDSYGYEYCANNHDLIPNVATPVQTVAELSKGRSLCRFGDGEFRLMMGQGGLDFQSLDSKLVTRLRQVWESNDENILIATNWHFFHSLVDINNADWVKNYLAHNRKNLMSIMDGQKQYYAAEVSCMYMVYKNMNHRAYYDNIRKIWENRDVVLVSGQGIRHNHQNDIFDNVRSIEHITAPSRDAFSEYDNILAAACKHAKDKLILIILGPTATVLAYDLAKMGYQALDIGHIAKDYDYFMQNKDTDINFFAPD